MCPERPGVGSVFDRTGRVVSVVVSKLRDVASPDDKTENVNFAINSNYLISIPQQAGMKYSKEGNPAKTSSKDVYSEKPVKVRQDRSPIRSPGGMSSGF